MTAIAALVDNDGVTMGGDSAGVAGYSLSIRKDPKVFCVGNLLIGYTSSFRMAQLIRYGLHDCLKIEDLDPPANPSKGFEFMVNDFVPRVRWLFDQGGFMKTDQGQEEGGTFLVAWDRQLFTVDSDMQVGELATPFAACGCGRDLVLGAFHAQEQYPMCSSSAADKVRISLEAASRFSTGVQGPFIVMSTNVRQ